MNTVHFLTIPAAIAPDQEIVVCGDRRQTYAKTLGRVHRLANALGALGVAKGDRVAVLDTNSARYVEAYFATSMLGGVFVPLNYRAKADELEDMVTTAGARLLFVGERYLSLVASLRERLVGVTHYVALESSPSGMMPYEELLAWGATEAVEAEVDEDDVNVLMYTSGTTGRPKGVMLTYGDFVAYVCGHTELADGTPRGSTLLCVPLYHIAGVTSMMTSLFAGRRLVILPQFDPIAWLDTVQRERITHAFLVPTMLKRVLDQPEFAHYDCSSLEVLAYGAAPMPLPVIRRAVESFPATVGFINAFGQTETTATVTMLLPEDHRLEGSPVEVERKLRRLSSIGRPLPDVEVKIVDALGAEVPRGEIGEIAVRTPRMMKGYLAEVDATAQTIIAGWLHTRDLGWMDEDGYVYLAGRKDDLIIRGGENISPAEIEAVLQAHPAVEEAAVIGVPDLEWGEQVMAIVVRKPGNTLSAEEVTEWCRQRLASFKKPELVHFVPELPRNPLGKVLRKDLRQQFVKQ
ncbi:MAG TPA: long-chain-fatty-acid--CoA ligase, partial [Alphaproteobacteria bacterium]|nr:long-chain-fatty-acid--CoA ligase [Alphaproteobacteria bacterium]